MRIFLIGFMGSGKTYWGRLLAQRLQLPFYDLDEVIVSSEGMAISEVFAEKGEEYFRLKEKEMLTDIIHTHPSFVLSSGGGTPCYFNNIDLMKREGVVVWLNAPIDKLKERLLREKARRPLLQQVGDEELHAFIIKKMNDRRLYYEQAHVQVDENETNIESLIQQILHA